MRIFGQTLTVLLAVIAISGCALSVRNARIADVQRDAGHYTDRSISIDGTVTNSWGLPLVPYKLYKVNDGTGEMTVISRGGSRTPVSGSHVKVKGVVRDVAVLGGQSLGLHLEEQSLDIRKN